MKWVIFTLIIFLLLGCSSQKYILTYDPNMIHSYHTKLINNGDWLNPNEEYQVLNKVIYIPNSLKENTILKQTIQYLNKNKLTECEKFLNLVKHNEKILPIAKGLHYISKKNYNYALVNLKNNKLNEWQYIVDILITDCEYEIALINRQKINFYDFLNKYQAVLDSYPIDSIYKNILNDRIKFVRYKI